LLRHVSASGFRPSRGTPSLNEIENAHDEDGIKGWPTLSPVPRDAARSFNHLVRPREQHRRHTEPQGVGSLQVDH
jgi:hypothetical protein